MKILLFIFLFNLVGCGKGLENEKNIADAPQVPITAPDFAFIPITIGASSAEAYNSSDWPYESIGDADVKVADFVNADRTAPTCVRTSFSFQFLGDGSQDCNGSNTPFFDSCVCTFDMDSLSTGQCRAFLRDVCSSDNTNIGGDIGDKINIGLNFVAPNNAPSSSSVSRSYQWYVQDSD